MKRAGVAAALTGLLVIACGTTTRPRTMDAGTLETPTEESRPDETADAFARGEALYAGSDYTGAAGAYEEHLSARPDDPRNDVVLLRLGMIYLVLGAPEREPERGEHVLSELTERFPSSPLRDVASYVLDLRREVETLSGDAERQRAEVQRLESQIEALKRIDLESGDTPR